MAGLYIMDHDGDCIVTHRASEGPFSALRQNQHTADSAYQSDIKFQTMVMVVCPHNE